MTASEPGQLTFSVTWVARVMLDLLMHVPPPPVPPCALPPEPGSPPSPLDPEVPPDEVPPDDLPPVGEEPPVAEPPVADEPPDPLVPPVSAVSESLESQAAGNAPTLSKPSCPRAIQNFEMLCMM